MRLPLFQVDAFTDTVFKGNPAAVVPLQQWLSDEQMQAIAAENNQPETAFFVREGTAFKLRWFTPVCEVDLCGHATLAAAHVLLQHSGWFSERLSFHTRSGELIVRAKDEGYWLDLPAQALRECAPPAILSQALGVTPSACYEAAQDYVVLLDNEAAVRALKPDRQLLMAVDKPNITVTARGEHSDIVSRCFSPQVGIDEDPVTGSAHTLLTPFWCQRLQRTELLAVQASARGGSLVCRLKDDRVELFGRAVTYLIGAITI